MKRVLVTGASGFVGSHLLDLLLDDIDCSECEVHGTMRYRSNLDNIKHNIGKDCLKLHTCDYTDQKSVDELIKEVNPHKIFHLAAHSFVPDSFHMPHYMLDNVKMTLNILESVKTHAPNCKVHIAGSSEEYGMVEASECPIDETQPLRPMSQYGVSKIACEYLAFQYQTTYNIKVIVTRSFNHTGPRRNSRFVCSHFARELALMNMGKKAYSIEHGNLDAIRDYTDVRDIVRAYWDLSELEEEIKYPINLCSGKGHKIEEVLNMLQSMSGISPQRNWVESRMRPSDVPLLVGSSEKAKMLIGWKPEINFKKTLEDLYDYWLENV